MDKHFDLALYAFTVVLMTHLKGIITDGDIRRMLSNVQKPLAALMSDDVIVHAIKLMLPLIAMN